MSQKNATREPAVRLAKRSDISRGKAWAIRAAAVLLALATGGLIILLLELPWKAAEFAIIIFVVQQVDGNFIAPRILGGATGLPGLGVLLAIVVGGAWFGIPGMVLGVPTLAVLAALLKQAVGAGLTARGLDENGEPRRNLPGGPQEN